MNLLDKGQLASTTIQCFTGVVGSLSSFPRLLKRVIEEEVWKCRVHDGRRHELPNLRALITEKPIAGWGQDPKKIEAVIKDDAEVLAMYREAMKEQGNHLAKTPEHKCYNVTLMGGGKGTGNSRAYAIDRVKREAPQFLSAVLAGEMSPNAALVKAGIRQNLQISLSKDPSRTAANIRKKMGEEYSKKLKQEL